MPDLIGSDDLVESTRRSVDAYRPLEQPHLEVLLDNIAVRPDRQGSGIGRRLMAFAESEARRLGHAELRLYTHVAMTENIALYTRLGFVETGRGHQAGYDRVFMRKQLRE